jgi:hypothetical protein
MDAVSLIVMEPGSAWPGHVHGSENIVTIGLRDEGLLPTTQHRLALFAERGQRVRVAVLACNAATDVAATADRADVAHALLGAVAAARFGRLVLSASDSAPIRLRCELVSLAGALSLAHRDTAICLRFIRAVDGVVSTLRRSALRRSTG